ncbi:MULTISPECIES: aspartate aminotransferase family protein [Sporosarcina]|uniref:Aspartate aminotransferase family protein n=1 Tax=Sporosarcina contaminans TaxID=633403 RepID=A0ABW3TXL6_9BACL
MNLTKSSTLYENIRKFVPGGVHSNSRFRQPHPIYFKEANGAYIKDVDDNSYLDIIMGNGAVILGHNNEEFNERMQERLKNGIITGLETELSIETAKKFLSFVTTADQVKFTNTGTEAVMHAMLIARTYTGKQDIAVVEGAYNGWHDAVNVSTWPNLDLAGDASEPNSLPGSLGLKEDVVKSTVVIPFNDLDATERIFAAHHERLAALIIEPTMIDVGYIPGSKEYLQGLKDLCSKYEIILVFDELLTGFRESKGGLQVRHGVAPDLSTFGKAISNGYPMAAVAGKAEIMGKSAPGPGSCSFVGTYNGHQVSLAASLSFMELYEELNVLEVLDRRTDMLIKKFNDSAKEKNISVMMRGKGGHFHWYFSDKAPNNYRDAAQSNKEAYQKFTHALSEQGVYCSGNYLLHHAISYAHKDAELEKLLKSMDEALRTLV